MLTLVSDRTHVLRFIFPKLLNPVLVAGARPLNHIHVWWQSLRAWGAFPAVATPTPFSVCRIFNIVYWNQLML